MQVLHYPGALLQHAPQLATSLTLIVVVVVHLDDKYPNDTVPRGTHRLSHMELSGGHLLTLTQLRGHLYGAKTPILPVFQIRAVS